jgi:hypothetical protein
MASEESAAAFFCNPAAFFCNLIRAFGALSGMVSRKFVEESINAFVTGHDFSRAAKAQN